MEVCRYCESAWLFAAGQASMEKNTLLQGVGLASHNRHIECCVEPKIA